MTIEHVQLLLLDIIALASSDRTHTRMPDFAVRLDGLDAQRLAFVARAATVGQHARDLCGRRGGLRAAAGGWVCG